VYQNDLLTVIERELGKPAPEGATVSARELAILAEIRSLKARLAPPPRRKAADNGKLASVTRDVVRACLEGESVRAVATEFGISDAQCRRVFYQQVLFACRRELNRLQALADAPGGEVHPLTVARLTFLVRAEEGNILGKAHDEYSLVLQALLRYWQAADELQAFTAESVL
jgi:transposase-like protein